MSKDNPVAITAEELDRVLNSIKDVNTQHIHEDYKTGVALSQSELDNLFKSKTPKSKEEVDRQDKIAKRNSNAARVFQQAKDKLPKHVSVVYGKATKETSFLSGLQAGDSIDLDRLAEQDADILVDGKLFARGRLEVVDGHASVRIVEILSC